MAFDRSTLGDSSVKSVHDLFNKIAEFLASNGLVGKSSSYECEQGKYCIVEFKQGNSHLQLTKYLTNMTGWQLQITVADGHWFDVGTENEDWIQENLRHQPTNNGIAQAEANLFQIVNALLD